MFPGLVQLFKVRFIFPKIKSAIYNINIKKTGQHQKVQAHRNDSHSVTYAISNHLKTALFGELNIQNQLKSKSM